MNNNEDKYRSPENSTEKPNYALRRIGIAILVILASYGLVKGIEPAKNLVNHLQNPLQYSDTMKEWVAGPGQGLNDAAAHVKGVGSVDVRDVTYHIEQMPENKDPLSDGLQAGEALTIPDSVTKR